MTVPEFITHPNPEIYNSDNYIVLDTETTNLEKGSAINTDNKLVVTVYRSNGDTKLVEGNQYQIKEVIDEIYKHDFLVAHNAKFDLQWLARAGLDLSKILIFDTQIAEYVLLGNKAVGNLSLSSVSKKYGFGGKAPFIDICMKGGVCPSKMPRSLLNKRCIKDVEQTESIFLEQRRLLLESGRLGTLYTRCILTPVLADIEFNGLHLDGDKVEETYNDYTRRLNKCREQLEDLSGGINFRSSKQLGEFLYGELGFSEFKDRRGNSIRTPGGGRKTDATTIAKLKPRSKRQRAFLEAYTEFNRLTAAISKNLEFFYGAVKELEGTFNGQFNQTITQTHRLSSSGRKTKFKQFDKPKSVQFQNLPRAFKPMFTARSSGWSIAEIDGAQLEFRVAAHLGRDDTATEAIRTGFDVHSFTAQTLTNAGQPTTRQDAKADTFKPLYGGQSGTKAQQAYYKAFRERYKGITETQNKWITTVLATKQLTIPSGLTFYWPNTKLEGDYITNTPSICNYPVQSYATADIIPIAVTRLWHDMKSNNMKSFLINTVHDSAIAELHPEEEELFSKLAFNAFTSYVYYYLHTVYNDDFTVPLGAELKIGSHWSKGKETMYTMEPPNYVNNQTIK